MAGIGFRLQRLLSGESYSDIIRAYLYSSVISCGPLLVVVGALALAKKTAELHLTLEQVNLFQGLIVYAFAFSLIGVSPFLYILTRYLADSAYLKKWHVFTPTYLSALEIVFLWQGLVAFIYLGFLPLGGGVKWILFSLYLFINGIWIAMVFLSAARSYIWIVLAFVLGACVSLLAGMFCVRSTGFSGFLFGYTLGQGFTFLILTLRIFLEFGYTASSNFGFLSYFKRYPYLIFAGLFYYLGIWADKLFFWYSSSGEAVIPGVRFASFYDVPMFLAFLTVVPSMAYLLIQMETSFARHFQAFYQAVRHHSPLAAITEKKRAIAENVTKNVQRFVLFQGLISGFFILFIYEVSQAFHLSPSSVGILRVAILGAFLQVGFLMMLNLFFYFDFQKEASGLCLFYFLSSGALTGATLVIGLPAYGFGFAAANFLTLVLSVFIFDQKLRNLEYVTFMKQPILIPKFKLEKG